MRAVPPLPGAQQRILHRVLEVLAGPCVPDVGAPHVADLGRGKGVRVREGGKQARPVVLGILEVMVVEGVPTPFDGLPCGGSGHALARSSAVVSAPFR